MDRNESLEKFEQYLGRRFPGRRTAIDYLSDIRQFMANCEKPLREVTLHDIDDFVDQQRAKGLKKMTINRRVAALKTFFDFLAEETEELSWANPVRFKRHAGKRGRNIPRDISDENIEKLWRVMPSKRDRAWFMLMIRGGLRVGEVVALKESDLEQRAQGGQVAKLRIKGKGEKERMVLLSEEADQVLQEWLEERGKSETAHIFINQHGKPLSVSGIEWLLHGYGEEVGIKLTPHQLRHTYARQLTEAGMSVTSLGKLMGHSQITTTQIYTAGADPGLCEAYQNAMRQVTAETQLSNLAEKEMPIQPPPTLQAAEVTEPEPELPDFESWASHLPQGIHEPCLEYVKHCLYTWPVRRRRQRAQSLLSELQRLWEWFIKHRSITQAGQLSFRDLVDYQQAHQAKGQAAGTINRRLDYVRAIGRRLADQEQPVDNSIFRVRDLPRPQSLPRNLTEVESQRLETFLSQRLQTEDAIERLENACLWVMLHSGLRSGECTDLRYENLDLASRRLTVWQGKGQRDRVVYLSDITCQSIRIYLQGLPQRSTGYLWQLPNGKPVLSGWLKSHVARIGKAVGIATLYPHRLRHTCATRLLNVGMDITRIQKLLGHEMLATTMIYARVQDATVEKDYRQFMQRIERQQSPLSNQPFAVDNWPTQNVEVAKT